MFIFAKTGLFMRLRATHWNLISRNLDMFESAFRYGLIPMQVPPSAADELEATINYIIDVHITDVGDKVVYK